MQNKTLDDLIRELDGMAIAITKTPEQFLPKVKEKPPDAPKSKQEAMIIYQDKVNADRQSLIDVMGAIEED